RDLASHLDTGERSLQRRFKNLTRISPKRFAPVARIKKVVASRLRGGTWGGAAHPVGYKGQAHPINEFKAKGRVGPAPILRSTMAAELRGWNAELSVSDFYNTFVI